MIIVMKKILKISLLLIGFVSFSQINGNLLLLKVYTERELEIDKYNTEYLLLELDCKNNIIKGETSKPVFIDEFTDSNIISCIKKDSIRIFSYNQNETFEHNIKIGVKNAKIITENSNKMNLLMEMNIKSFYNKKIYIYYSLISADYCSSTIAKQEGNMLNYNGKITLILSELKINNDFLIPKDKQYEIIKAINFNYFLY
jgi:hypothetical protein